MLMGAIIANMKVSREIRTCFHRSRSNKHHKAIVVVVAPHIGRLPRCNQNAINDTDRG